jgi:catechol 2,3-dioxygenase-like lactoylglutathione lyase family enzyme
MVDLFAGISVRDLESAVEWYGRLFGQEPAFYPNDREAVFEIDEHRYVYVESRPAHAGHALHTLFVDDLDERVAAASARGIEPARREQYDNGVRKFTYIDADGNETGFGGAPE